MPSTYLPSSVKPVARAGLIAKGIVYFLLGFLAFMAAFEIGGQSNENVDKKGVFDLVESTGGKLLLGLLAAGLLCYTVWRVTHAVIISRRSDDTKKKVPHIIRYIFSGLIYLSLAFYALQRLLGNGGKGKDDTRETVSQLMQKPFGPWLVGITGLILIATGIYQIYYGLSGKYRKHVDGLNLRSGATNKLLFAGKTGYVSRGIVWLLLAWLVIKAALHANAGEAGDISKASSFLENTSYGSVLLGVLGLGLICYGFFNFVRARYETFS